MRNSKTWAPHNYIHLRGLDQLSLRSIDSFVYHPRFFVARFLAVISWTRVTLSRKASFSGRETQWNPAYEKYLSVSKAYVISMIGNLIQVWKPFSWQSMVFAFQNKTVQISTVYFKYKQNKTNRFEHLLSSSKLASSRASSNSCLECPLAAHRLWTASGTLQVPLGFISHKRRKRWSFAAWESPSKPSDSDASGSGLPFTSLRGGALAAEAGDGPGCVAGGVLTLFGILDLVAFSVLSASISFCRAASWACILILAC